jgi:glycosyltransferase involved in cell wall biosynthesis
MEKIKVAFIKFGGLCAGGTERFLHAIAANLPKEEFVVDYYYCDAAPYLGSDWKHPDTDPFRKKYLEDKNVNLIKFHVQFKDVRTPMHDWVGTNLWELFNEDNYDVIMTGRAGHPEYPFYLIKNKPIINILTLIAGVDNQSNVFKTIQISEWAGERWIQQGGDASRLEIIPIFQEFPKAPFENLREKLNISNKFIYGFHQRNTEDLFSEVPLQAYKKIQSDDTAFILLGGSSRYREQAKGLGLINFISLEHTGDEREIHSFLETIDVFTHGRNDGETFGAVFTEAMYHKKPCISHKSAANGHIEVIGSGGNVFERHDIESYSNEMLKLKNDIEYYKEKSISGYNHYVKNYSLESQNDRIIKIIKDATKSYIK